MSATSREDLLATLRALKPEIKARYKAREIGLFGSFVRGEHDGASDVDVLVRAMPYELQWRVPEFTRALVVSTPHGIPGRQLLRFAGAIPPDDLQLMRQAIEQGCEQVDANEW